MRGVNKVILIGNATRDAELRPTQNEKPVSSIRLATNRTVKGEEETQFHTIVCWDRLAETTAEYVKKGDPLYVEGRRQFCAESRAYLQHRRHSGLEAGPPRGLLSDGRRSRLA
jgi:single stranded DNA-binding protein